ncbi:MAG TPA: hypothetical protein VNQ76_17575 [Planctomicrobium sp.]|nr:hypothetical protein [Planctomicrobium sp.]
MTSQDGSDWTENASRGRDWTSKRSGTVSSTMAYATICIYRANAEIGEVMGWWRDHRSPEQAARWINEFIAAINSLQDDPERFPLAPESDLHPAGLRQ